MLAQVRLLSDSGVCGPRRQHPYRDLQPPAICIQDSDCSVSALRSTDELETRTAQWVEWIQHLHTRRIRVQGIVSAGASIHISTVSFRSAAFHQIAAIGYDRGIAFSFRSVFSRKSSEASFSRDSNVRIAGTSSVSAAQPGHSKIPRHSGLFYNLCVGKTGSSMSNRPWRVPGLCFAI